MAATAELRLGPRPLPLHLTSVIASWLSSSGASALLSSGSLPWKPELAERAARLSDALDGVEPDRFVRAVERAGRARFGRFMDGVLTYRRLPRPPRPPEPPTVWRDGAARLLDFAPDAPRGRPAALIVPSLVNRWYVLDLALDRSLVRALAAAGVRPLVLDWDQPGEEERDFTLTDYVCGPLEAAIARAGEIAGTRPGLVGYCMGGLLALAAALRRPADLKHLTLLATPWDFHTDPLVARRMAVAAPGLGIAIEGLDGLPVDALQAMFAGVDPWSVPRKFDAFARKAARDPEDPGVLAFLALEDWLNDGVNLARAVARECVVGWYGRNSPPRGRWRIAGRRVDPRALELPAMVMIAGRDRIVPPDSSRPLADMLPNAVSLTPPLGHIGMVAGGSAPRLTYAPLIDWCLTAGR